MISNRSAVRKQLARCSDDVNKKYKPFRRDVKRFFNECTWLYGEDFKFCVCVDLSGTSAETAISVDRPPKDYTELSLRSNKRSRIDTRSRSLVVRSRFQKGGHGSGEHGRRRVLSFPGTGNSQLQVCCTLLQRGCPRDFRRMSMDEKNKHQVEKAIQNPRSPFATSLRKDNGG